MEVKKTEIVLVPCSTWKCVSTAISCGMDVSNVLGCQLLQKMSSQWGLQELIRRLASELKEVAILSKLCKPDHFKWDNYLKLSFTNIWALHSNFDGCEFFLEANSPDILALCKTNIDDSVCSGNFRLIWKDYTTDRHGLAV